MISYMISCAIIILGEGCGLPMKRKSDSHESRSLEIADEIYNGKILLRVSRSLHHDLILNAKENNLSLNAYIIQLISRQISLREVMDSIQKLSSNSNQNITEEKNQTFSPLLSNEVYKK